MDATVTSDEVDLLAGELALARQQARCAREELEGLHMAFDGRGVPRFCELGIVYSLWGRALWFAKHAKRSDLDR